MKFLARDPVPIFLGNAGVGNNFGATAAQLGKFDVFYTLPPPIAIDPEAEQEDTGTATIVLDNSQENSEVYLSAESFVEESSVVVPTTAPSPQVGIFDVVYEEDVR